MRGLLTGGRLLGELTSREVGSGLLLAVPLGAIEQHGPHLPLDTDSRVAEWLAAGLAAGRDDTVVAPAVAVGSSGEHAGFPGTLSIGQEALELMLVELVRSLGPEFAGTVFVCGHGGNRAPLHRAAARLREEGRRVLPWMARYPGDLHAGRSETSIMLALAPELVHGGAAEKGDTRPAAELIPLLESGGVRSVSPNGVLGDPTGASETEGRRLLTDLLDRLRSDVLAWERETAGTGTTHDPRPLGRAAHEGGSAADRRRRRGP